MGLFSRKPKQETIQKETPIKRGPDLTLNYPSGTTAEVNFVEGKIIDGKYLSVARVIYTPREGNFFSNTYLLEPILEQGEDKKTYDYTKIYYQNLIKTGNMPLVKGFFKLEDLTEDLIGSNYIGKLKWNEQGKPIREYDESFRQKYIIQYKENILMKNAEEAYKNELADQAETDRLMINPGGYGEAIAQNNEYRYSKKDNLSREEYQGFSDDSDDTVR